MPVFTHVIDPSQVLLAAYSVLLDEKPSGAKFKNRRPPLCVYGKIDVSCCSPPDQGGEENEGEYSTYTKWIDYIAVAMHQLEQLASRKSTISVFVILCEHILELLGPESPFAVICPAVRPMLS